ncbi:plastid division protein PDV2 [Humulus lupulus]|uniref:plastid division protein PDV2 n=1 Tax=Humulus lupulus TaxID=3486 RepID=UPI002B40E07C|nr:plastid division protein PDV2 [Humulus lupulus]
MEEEGIGLVLARATELRLKIGNCIHKASSPRKVQDDPLLQKENGVHSGGFEEEGEEEELEKEEEEEEEAQRLLNICDALESLETQLSSLQALQQQQRYEREVALTEIEQSRKALLGKLKEYKGEELEVINEASAFAGETVEQNNDLLLPPYPSRPPHSICRENGYLPHFPSMHKLVRNGVVSVDPANTGKKNTSDSEQNKNSRGLGFFLGAAAKTVFTIVGVVSMLSLSGFGPKFFKRDTSLKLLGSFHQPVTEEKRSSADCPPGRILVVENGEARCLVKERVEVPFSSAAAKPDVNYGCG